MLTAIALGLLAEAEMSRDVEDAWQVAVEAERELEEAASRDASLHP